MYRDVEGERDPSVALDETPEHAAKGDQLSLQLERERARRATMERLAHRCAADPNSTRLLQTLLGEAVMLLEASLGILYRWDPASGALVAVRATFAGEGRMRVDPVPFGANLCGRAAALHRPIVSRNLAEEFGGDGALAGAGMRAALAVPLLHDGRLLGVLTVATTDASAGFTADDVEAVGAIGDLTAVVIAGLERERLLDVSPTVQHLAGVVKNELMMPLSAAGLLQDHPDLLPSLWEMVDVAVTRLDAAAKHMHELAELVRFRIDQVSDAPVWDAGPVPPSATDPPPVRRTPAAVRAGGRGQPGPEMEDAEL